MNTGLIFDIRRFCVHDGPGIRTTLFFKGCPLNCLWCHNPESINPGKEHIQKPYKLGDETICKDEVIGQDYSIDDLLDTLIRDHDFYQASKGGVTLSGGEPMMQFDFILGLCTELKKQGIHIALDTSGFAPPHQYIAIGKHIDLVLFDIKHLDPVKHKAYTGQDNEQILNNLDLILGQKLRVFIRFPLIPGINDDDRNLSAMRDLLIRYPQIEELHILPYHRIANSKYQSLGREFPTDGIMPPSEEYLECAASFLQNQNATIKIGG